MKKIFLLFLIAILLVGCGNEGSPPKDSNPESANNIVDDASDDVDEDEEGIEAYVFETKGVEIAMNAQVAPIIESLGEYKEFFEAESCAFQGMEKTYTYDGFDLYTYEIDGVDSVASISFLDDSVKTQEGIYLYSSLDDMIDAYGDDYEESLGLYTYVQGDSELAFLVDNDEVVSIEYIAVTE